MVSGGSDRNAEYKLSKLLQIGTMAEYQDEFEKLINRVTVIFESLLTSFYISGLKLTLSIELLRARPLGEAFSLARIIEARLEAIAEKEKEHIIKKKAYTILSLRSELASPEIKGSLDADEDIGIDEVSSAIDCIFHICESNEVRSKFGEFSENKKSVIELGVYREKSRRAAEGGRRVLCYVQGSKRLKKKKMKAAIQRRLWDPRIKSAFQDNTLRARYRNAEYELSKLLQIGTVAEYHDEFEKLINQVTGISESLLTSFYISGLKLTLSIELLRARPFGEAFSLARIIEARLEAIAEKEKEHIIKKKACIILSLRSELASPEIKGSLDADEDIGIDEVSSAIDCVFHIGESNEVRSKFDEFSENKKSVIEVVMGGGEALGVYREKSRGAAEGGRRVLCYVQGSKRLKKKKMEAAIQRRLWDPGIKSAFQDNTLRAMWF
ncbi:retrotransposon gag protein [Tanacetum coccineum]